MTSPLIETGPGPDHQPQESRITSLGALLDKIDEAAQHQHCISFADILALIGRRWYGPILFLAGMVMMTPVIGDIPGVPIMMGAIVILTSVQLLWKRKKVWLPLFLRNRHIDSAKVRKGLRWFRRPARIIDAFTAVRMEWAVKQAGLTMIALMSIMIAAITPLLELIPFSATLAGFAIAAFGVSVLAADGVVALLAIAFSVATFVMGGSFLIGS